MQNPIPLSSHEIPAGTGLLQHVECTGIAQSAEDGKLKHAEALLSPVIAEITTFADGIRKVCCLHAKDFLGQGNYKCLASGDKSNPDCIYTWKNRK
ncbi:MAG: hypothetical protein KBD00_00510 [Candidatus Peribacteraceae bacterium]|nr:hypothetical protein [Candidatus Peribacteraceae bacterium]